MIPRDEQNTAEAEVQATSARARQAASAPATSHALQIIEARLARIRAAGLWRSLTPLEGPPGPWITIAGRRYLHLCSNNYLGLSTAPEVVAAVQRAAAEWGAGAGAARLVTGDSAPARELEAALAEFKGAEAALVFPSGYLANMGAVTGVASRGDWLVCDELNHASLIDAARLSRAEVRVYPHNDAEAAARLLNQAPPGVLKAIVTDGVFSMDGDVAPLTELARLAEEHDALLIVDDAHGTGIMGPGGRGACAAAGIGAASPGASAGILNERVIHVMTLSKALGVQGGAVAGPRVVIDAIINRARSFIFETAPAPPILAGALAALRLIEADTDSHRARLAENATFLRQRLAELGVPVPPGDTPIIPVVIGDNDAALRAQAALREMGYWVTAIRPPTVPAGTARLRVTVMADHSRADLERFAADLATLVKASIPM